MRIVKDALKIVYRPIRAIGVAFITMTGLIGGAVVLGINVIFEAIKCFFKKILHR